MDTVSTDEENKQRLPRRGIFLGALAILVTILLCAAAIYYKDQLMSMAHMESYSLLGVLIIAFIAGSIVSITAMPIPYVLVVFAMPSVLAQHWGILAPVWVGTISALGVASGQSLTFMIGYGGRRLYQRFTFSSKNRFYTKVMGWAQRHGSWAVFSMSVIFNPFHLPMTIAMAALRFPPLKFFLFSLLGNMVKSLFIAFCGYFGLGSLFRFLGM